MAFIIFYFEQLFEPGNEMYGHYFCPRCVCVCVCMYVGRKKKMLSAHDITGPGSKPW